MSKINLKLGFALNIAVLTVVGCTSTINIEVSESELADHVATDVRTIHGSQMSPVENQLDYVAGPYTLVLLKSESDLQRIVNEKGLAYAYYRIFKCGNQSKNQELYSAPLLMSDVSDIESDTGYEYFAYIPVSIRHLVAKQLEMQSIEKPELLENWDSLNLCMNIGAGSMSGYVLTSNTVDLNLKKP